MRRPNSSSKTTLVAASVAASLGLCAGAAFAQTTTSANASDEAAADSTTARHVTLTRQQNERMLHYAAARNLRICNLSGQAPSAAESINAAEQRAPQTRSNIAIEAPKTQPSPVALQVSYAGMSHQIQPGNCYEFQARNVRLGTAPRLPTEGVLDVSIAQMSGNGFVNGRTVAASSGSSAGGRLASDRDTKQSVKDLKEQLKQDDEQEQQANAELSQAREKLAQTTRDLKQAESKEHHVASAERHTSEAERQEQQRAQQAPPNGPSPE